MGNNNINNGNSRSSSGGENNRIISNSNEIKILKNEVKLNKLHTEGEIKNILRLYNDIRIKVNNNEEDIVEIVQLLNKNPSTLNRPSTSSTSTDDSDVLELIYKIDDKID